MKTHSLILLAAVLACHGSAAAQTGSPRAQELQPRARETGVARDGIVFYRGQTYLVRHGRAALVDAVLVPEGMVLMADGARVPLPSDFSGFVLDRAPDGTVLPTPPAQAGPQVLSGQAGVAQAPSMVPQATERRPLPMSLELPRVVALPVAEEVRTALPLPTNLLPPPPPTVIVKKTP